MCGIFGYWSRERQALPEAALGAMARALIHRGPDDEGIHHDRARGVGIGNRRLSIIDLAGGHQPMFSADGRIAVVQNGEIFNFVELARELQRAGVRLQTQSDTEVILRLYEREGIACLKRLNGMFAIAIDDAREDALYLARDRVGEKPLYVHDDGERLLFGSEIKAFLPLVYPSRSPDQIDLEALHHYLSFNYLPPPWTIWRGIRHVMPGTWMKWTRRGPPQIQRWWRLADQHEEAMAPERWREEFLGLIDDATRIRLRADVPFGAFLSGGVDSSTVTGLMARHVREPVKTFCIGFEDARFDESRHAALAAARFGCAHHGEIAQPDMLSRWAEVLHHLDQPHGDVSFMPTLRVSELAARHVKVVLTGDGGDELFAGYEKYARFFASAPPGADFAPPYFESISLFTRQARQALYRPELARALAGVDSFAAVARPWFDEAAHLGPVNQALYLDMQLLLPGNNLVKPDRMGMAVSIEARAPFLDWRLMEFAFRSPGETKLSASGETKHWVKQAVAPLIGQDLAYREKQMFTVPIGEWMRGPSRAWFADLLMGSALLAGWFRREAIVSMFERHGSGQANHTRELRALAALALWAKGVGLE